MDVKAAIEARRSVRSYVAGYKLSDEELKALMKAAQLAPSVKNIQPYYFIVVVSDRVKRRLSEAVWEASFIRDASAIFVIVGKPRDSPWYKIDAAIAGEHIVLQAVELGLGSCWLTAFSRNLIRSILAIPPEEDVVAMIAVGKPAEHHPRAPKKPIGELFKVV